MSIHGFGIPETDIARQLPRAYDRRPTRDAPTPMPHLAFDFGLKYIGVAVAEHRHGTATALSTVGARDGVPMWDRLDVLVREWRPEGFVVGLPLNMDGTESDMSDAARRFGARLERRYGVGVEFVDERLSTFEAAQRGGSHDTAASIIAETWLSTAGTPH